MPFNDFEIEHSYDSILLSVERVLSKKKGKFHERQLACPDCLANYPIQDVVLLDWNQLPNSRQTSVQCKAGHVVGISFTDRN